MALVTDYDIFGGDSDLSDVPLDDESDVSPPPTATKQKPSLSQPSARLVARDRAQSHGNLALASANEPPTRSARLKALRSTYTISYSSSSSEFSPISSPSPPPFVAPASRKRKTRPGLLIDTTPAKRRKKQERSLFDDVVDTMDKTTTPSKYTTAGLPLGLTPSQSPSRQEEWNFRMLVDTKVFVKLLRANGSPAASDAPFAEIYWWPARVSNMLLSLTSPINLPLVQWACHPRPCNRKALR